MQRIFYNNKAIVSSVIALSFLSVVVTTVGFSNGLLGYNPYPSHDQSIRSSQSTLQGSHCYSPNASIINSCNSGEQVDSDSMGKNLVW
jgi:hypothetical protein